ncbi:MAG: hypothetical protein NT011_02345 [Kiritimatiellaeota bacterium]|nr:hypothetical protein [Kiritimatiellota bacterium]
MWRKILDDVEVRVLVLKQLEQYCAIVQFDLVTVSQELADAFYKEISDIKELSFRNMIVTATHSHTAPEVRTIKAGIHPDYIPFAVKKAAEALREALGGMVRGEVFGGLAEDKRFCFNRRYWMKDGTVVTNPGKLNPAIDRPEGEVDCKIPLIGIKSGGKLKVLIANIVNHTDTIGGSDVSADWPGFFIRRIQSGLGGGSMVLPLIGASGNINHFDVSTDMNQTCYAEAERVGCGYAASVEKALPKLRPLKDFTLFTRQMEVVCGPREIPDNELAEAKLVLEKYKDLPDVGPGADMTSEDLARKEPKVLKYFARNLLDLCNDHEARKFNLVGIFLGNFCIVSLPCEPFVEIGLEIKKKIFTHYNAMVVSHSNGTGNLRVGGAYIPNAFNYGRGGYETTPRSNLFSVQTADRLIDAWRKIAQTVR